ncbi:GNAT family N-acetyltransferase, partial [Bacillus cereus]|nr:GNAT family N-acetyltransferase [Bacillus cereus]
MIRLLTKADAKQYWELRLQALQVNPEAFIT